MSAMEMTERLDSITVEDLRAVGGEKWSTYPGALGAFVAEMDFGLAPAIGEALADAVASGLVGYLPEPVSRDSSAAAAMYLRREFGYEAPPERVRPVADVLDCFVHAMEHFSAPGSPIIIPTPAYSPFPKIAALQGRRIVEVPLEREGASWRLPVAGIRAALAGEPGLVVLCNPHNPTGAVHGMDELLALSQVVEEAGARVFSDEIHASLVHPGRRHIPYASVSAAAAGHTVTAISASKAWNIAGLKCAHLVLSNDADLETWHREAPRAELSASTLGAVAAIAAYRHGGPWLEGIREYLDGNRRVVAEALREHLPTVRFSVPDATYFAWLDCRELGIPGNPRDYFLEHAAVALTDGEPFGAVGRGHVRLNFAMPRPILRQAIANMGAAVRAFHHG